MVLGTSRAMNYSMVKESDTKTRLLEGIPTSCESNICVCLFLAAITFVLRKECERRAELPENLGFICFCFDKKATKIVMQHPISCHKFNLFILAPLKVLYTSYHPAIPIQSIQSHL